MIQLDPTFYNAAYSKASCENILGRFDDAIATYNLAFIKDEEISEKNSPIRTAYSRSSLCTTTKLTGSGLWNSPIQSFNFKTAFESPSRLNESPVNNMPNKLGNSTRSLLNVKHHKLINIV